MADESDEIIFLGEEEAETVGGNPKMSSPVKKHARRERSPNETVPYVDGVPNFQLSPIVDRNRYKLSFLIMQPLGRCFVFNF